MLSTLHTLAPFVNRYTFIEPMSDAEAFAIDNPDAAAAIDVTAFLDLGDTVAALPDGQTRGRLLVLLAECEVSDTLADKYAAARDARVIIDNGVVCRVPAYIAIRDAWDAARDEAVAS